MFHSGTMRLIDFWSGLNAGQAPARADFDPVGVADLLPQMFLLAREGDRLAFRIAGEVLRDLFGRPLRGQDVFGLFPASARDMARRTALQAIRDRAPIVMIATGRTDAGAEVSLEILLAPLLDAQGAPDRLVGMIQPTSTLFALEGRPVTGLTIRVAAPAPNARPRAPRLRLAALNGRRIA